MGSLALSDSISYLVVVDAGEQEGVVPGEPQPRPGVGLRAGGGAELGGDEAAEVLLGSAPARPPTCFCTAFSTRR